MGSKCEDLCNEIVDCGVCESDLCEEVCEEVLDHCLDICSKKS